MNENYFINIHIRFKSSMSRIKSQFNEFFIREESDLPMSEYVEVNWIIKSFDISAKNLQILYLFKS